MDTAILLTSAHLEKLTSWTFAVLFTRISQKSIKCFAEHLHFLPHSTHARSLGIESRASGAPTSPRPFLLFILRRDLTKLPRLALNLQSFCLGLPISGGDSCAPWHSVVFKKLPRLRSALFSPSSSSPRCSCRGALRPVLQARALCFSAGVPI